MTTKTIETSYRKQYLVLNFESESTGTVTLENAKGTFKTPFRYLINALGEKVVYIPYDRYFNNHVSKTTVTHIKKLIMEEGTAK